jgi:hypothetical protein
LRTTTTTWQGYPPSSVDDRHGCHITATSEALDVTPAGRIIASSVVIEAFTQTDGGTDKILLPPGTRILCTLSGKTTQFSIEGKTIDQGTLPYLSRLLYLDADDTDPDLLYNTRVPRHIGETWSVDPKITYAAFTTRGNQANPSDISTELTLASIKPIDGNSYFDIKRTFTVKSYIPAGYLPAPSGMAFKDASYSSQTEGFIPVNTNIKSRSYHLASSNLITTTGSRDNLSFTMKQDMEEQEVFQQSPLPPATQPASTKPAGETPAASPPLHSQPSASPAPASPHPPTH